MHSNAASNEMVPTPHAAQAVAPSRPDGYEYLPAVHQSQTCVRPVDGFDVPRMHRVQSESVVLEQTAHPAKALYLPGPHRVQTVALPSE